MTDTALRIMLIGAHPDDADIKGGGTAAKWCELGHTVRMVSVCDGAAGHHIDHGPSLAARRRAEAESAASVIGASYEILEEPDGELQPTLSARRKVIRAIRSFRPDVVITHRTTDYHPDHCYTGLLVQEAAYLLTVPAICPETPHMAKSPVILYFSDAFQHPCRFEAHLVVDIEDKLEQLVSMLHCHSSQFYEWLPSNAGHLDEVPAENAERRRWLGDRISQRIRPLADCFRELVEQTYGIEQGAKITHIEAFQVSEFGEPLDASTCRVLFPFLPERVTANFAIKGKEWVDIPVPVAKVSAIHKSSSSLHHDTANSE